MNKAAAVERELGEMTQEIGKDNAREATVLVNGMERRLADLLRRRQARVLPHVPCAQHHECRAAPGRARRGRGVRRRSVGAALSQGAVLEAGRLAEPTMSAANVFEQVRCEAI